MRESKTLNLKGGEQLNCVSMSHQIIHIGIDVGSTTVKVVILNEKEELLF